MRRDGWSDPAREGGSEYEQIGASGHSGCRDRERPLTRAGWIDIQAPISVLWVVRRESIASIGSRSEESAAVALARLDNCAVPRRSRIAAWWLTMTREVPSRRESVEKEVHKLEEVWLSSAKSVGYAGRL